MRIGRYIVCLVIFACLACAESRAEVLTLDSCLQLARQNNPQLRKSQLDVQRAEEVKVQAFTKYFPQVQGNAFGFHALHPLVEVGIDDISNATARDLLTALYGNYGAALGLENTIGLLQYGYTVGVSAVQPVFVGGKIVAGNRLAQVGVDAARLQAEIARRDILEQTEESYWLVYGLQQKQQIIDDATALLDTLCRFVSVAVDAGLALPSDLAQVEIRRDDIRRRELQLQSGLHLARRALALSIGVADGDSIEVTDLVLDSVSSLTLAGLNAGEVTTPEHQLLALQIRAAELKRQMSLADALPQIAVGATYGYGYGQTNLLRNGLHSRNGNGALFVTMSVPLTAWWETSHKLKEQRYAIEQARIDAEHIGTQLELRTQQAYDQSVQAAALVELNTHTLSHAREAYRQTEANYRAGLATLSELLQAQMTLTQAQSDLTDAQTAYRLALRRYTDLTTAR